MLGFWLIIHNTDSKEVSYCIRLKDCYINVFSETADTEAVFEAVENIRIDIDDLLYREYQSGEIFLQEKHLLMNRLF